jgi:hypothetical protein
MKQTKHIIILVITLFVFGQAAQSQSTARNPYEDAIHEYTCNGISKGAGYEFYITANADGNGRYDDGLTGEFDILNPKGTVGQNGLASTPIKWNTGAAAHVYYLWLKANDVGGCSNFIQIQISPQINQFDLLSENISINNTVSCPAVASIDGFNPLASAYDAGTTTLKFIVKRINGTDNKLTASAGDTYDWKFEPALSVDPVTNTGILIVSVVGLNSGNLVADSNRLYTVNGADNEVTVTVAIKNVFGTAQDVKLMIKNQIENQSTLPDSNAGNDTVKHRIEVLPVIENLQGL